MTASLADLSAVQDDTGDGMLARPFSGIPARPVWWLWAGLVPFRHVTLLVAPGKTSKGLVAIALASLLSMGQPMPGDKNTRPPMNAVIVAPEDDENEAIRPRLDASGADVSRVFNLTKLPDGTLFGLPGSLPDLRTAVAQIERETGTRTGLVILDPLLALVSRSLSTDAAARSITEPLEDFAHQPLGYDPLNPRDLNAVHPGLAVLLTQHTTKEGKTAGAAGLVNSVRMVLRLERQVPGQLDHPGRRLYVEATNLTDAKRAERYMLTGRELDTRIQWGCETRGTLTTIGAA